MGLKFKQSQAEIDQLEETQSAERCPTTAEAAGALSAVLKLIGFTLIAPSYRNNFNPPDPAFSVFEDYET